MELESIQAYARERKITQEEALQVFFQVLVLKHLSHSNARFMGGTALVLGYANPRFSEDIDLTQVKNPLDLSQGLKNARLEAHQWVGYEIKLKKPKPSARTWKFICSINPARSVRLHIDSQPFRAYTTRPMVIEFPGIPSFVCPALSLTEILAEKLMALAFRKYLSGRDLFDLWFHWLRKSDWTSEENEIRRLTTLKLKERKLTHNHYYKNLKDRILKNVHLKRARYEWKRYLPPDFQHESVFEDILKCHHKLI